MHAPEESIGVLPGGDAAGRAADDVDPLVRCTAGVGAVPAGQGTHAQIMRLVQ